MTVESSSLFLSFLQSFFVWWSTTHKFRKHWSLLLNASIKITKLLSRLWIWFANFSSRSVASDFGSFFSNFSQVPLRTEGMIVTWKSPDGMALSVSVPYKSLIEKSMVSRTTAPLKDSSNRTNLISFSCSPRGPF